ncbi:hypothetical protein ASC90_27495 [Rhizobium sp. Root1220]|nr:hypothetical protein ASC90_27495 [Rhizobium sp. Root1220]
MNSGDRSEYAGKEIPEDGSDLLTGKAMTAFERVKAYRNTRPRKGLGKSFSLIDRRTIIVFAVKK